MTDRHSNGPAGPDAEAAAESAATGSQRGEDPESESGAGSTGGDATATDAAATDASALEELESALERARIELERSQDRFVRLAAEFDNYRKRTDRERTDVYGRAQAELIGRMLEAVDDLERVADFDETTPSKALLEGVQLVEKKLLAAFEGAGLRRLDAAGKKFDPATMEALATVPTDVPDQDEIVSDVFQPGYRFGETLVRPARVRVKQFED